MYFLLPWFRLIICTLYFIKLYRSLPSTSNIERGPFTIFLAWVCFCCDLGRTPLSSTRGGFRFGSVFVFVFVFWACADSTYLRLLNTLPCGRFPSHSLLLFLPWWRSPVFLKLIWQFLLFSDPKAIQLEGLEKTLSHTTLWPAEGMATLPPGQYFSFLHACCGSSHPRLHNLAN